MSNPFGLKHKKGKSSYFARWGHERTRTLKGHPRRVARQLGAKVRNGE